MTDFKILDGAMGSELIKRGLTLPRHIWSAEANIVNPNIVHKIHAEYIDAGVDYITTNTFRTTPRAYLKTGVSTENAIQMARDSLLNSVKLAQDASSGSVKIIASIAPLEDCYAPKLFPGPKLAVKEFRQLGKWLSSANVDILLLETMNSTAETEAGLIALQNIKRPIWVSFVLNSDCNLLSGDSFVDVLKMIKHYSVDCIMLNCNPLDRTMIGVEILVDNWSDKWGVYPNLGVGEPSSSGHIIHYEEMVRFLDIMEKIIYKSPFILGACCGSSPEHIARLCELKLQCYPSYNI